MNLGDNPWLTYSNSGATRNQPLNEKLINAMSFLPDMGITMDVYSGGQPSSGPNRVGSVRHDHGNAADVTFHRDGRMLDWNNPSDISILSDIVSRARSAGVTGIGAGNDYMGPGRVHIGFGEPAVWGAGGRSVNAPDWLRSAYYREPVNTAPALQAVANATNTPTTRKNNASASPQGLLSSLFANAGNAVNNAVGNIGGLGGLGGFGSGLRDAIVSGVLGTVAGRTALIEGPLKAAMRGPGRTPVQRDSNGRAPFRDSFSHTAASGFGSDYSDPYSRSTSLSG